MAVSRDSTSQLPTEDSVAALIQRYRRQRSEARSPRRGSEEGAEGQSPHEDPRISPFRRQFNAQARADLTS